MSPWAALVAPAPWLAPCEPLRRHLAELCQAGAGVAEALNRVLATRRAIELAAGPLRFVDAAELPAGEAYESFIARTACVPTRDNAHDLFNGLAWLRFPLVKRRLNELQADAIARDGIGPTRGALRDALTLFDENGAWLSAPAGLRDALHRRDWHELFIARRDEWAHARLTLFGHALLEKLASARKGITAHVWCLESPAVPWNAGDEADEPAVLALLQPDRLGARGHLPLPVLGVPGWWPANEHPGFYDDESVFRRAGRRPVQAPGRGA